jgi:hypothetical protein
MSSEFLIAIFRWPMASQYRRRIYLSIPQELSLYPGGSRRSSDGRCAGRGYGPPGVSDDHRPELVGVTMDVLA